jgi:elongation factor P
MKVNANQLRAGNVIDMDGRLYSVLKAESVKPGKGTAVTRLELRRISDGIKTEERFRTSDSVERVFIDERDFTYLFKDGESYTFMDVENYEQVPVSGDLIGDQKIYLLESMPVRISLNEGVPVSVELPQTVILDVVETDPTVKGQTSAASYKPAMMSNGARIMVPPHITVGARIVVDIQEESYIERAKD